MKFCSSINIITGYRAPAILILLLLLLCTGCNTANLPKTRTLEIKTVEERMKEYNKKLHTVEELTLETEIISQILIAKGTPENYIEYVNANMKILPFTDSRQKISNLEIIPAGNIIEHALEFKLVYPLPGRYEFKVRAEVELRHEFIKVTEKNPFPLKTIPDDLIKYTKSGLIIDSDNNDIRILSSKMAQGEDDLYRVVFNACKWVKDNVKTYIDNSTVYTSQKASWVLEHKKGVCDEKTSLLIGILRSLGIPAKFIIGFVSKNYDDKIDFFPHSWAEVYFPSAGWVPFDVAYNQMGFIDATHLKLAESVDTSEPLTTYEWKAIDISDHNAADKGMSGNTLISIKDLKVKTEIKQERGNVIPLLKLKTKAWYNNIATGSCNVIETTIINPHKYYVITEIRIQSPKEVKNFGETSEMILMAPETRKTLYWIVKPEINIEGNMTAVFPVNVFTSENIFTSVKFSVEKGKMFSSHSFEWIKTEVEKKKGN
jgi:hypothetical protein